VAATLVVMDAAARAGNRARPSYWEKVAPILSPKKVKPLREKSIKDIVAAHHSKDEGEDDKVDIDSDNEDTKTAEIYQEEVDKGEDDGQRGDPNSPENISWDGSDEPTAPKMRKQSMFAGNQLLARLILNPAEEEVHEEESKFLIDGKANRYCLTEELGRGAFARVLLCKRDDGKICAAKAFFTKDKPGPLQNADPEAMKRHTQAIRREIVIMKKCSKHPAFVSIDEHITIGDSHFLIMDKMDFHLGSLPVDRKSRGRPSPIEVVATAVLKQVLSGLEFLHSQHVVHRDVKPENILVNVTVKKIHGFKETIYNVKLGDLGSARVLPKEGGTRVGSQSPLTLALDSHDSADEPPDERLGFAVLSKKDGNSAMEPSLTGGSPQSKPESNSSGGSSGLRAPTLVRRETANTKAFRTMILDTRKADACMTSDVGSIWYQAPEVLEDGSNFTPSADVWALGVTIREFITGSVAFPGSDGQEVLDLMLPYYRQVSPELIEVLTSRDLIVDPAKCSRKHLHTELANLQVHFKSLLDRCMFLEADERDTVSDLLLDVNSWNTELF